ncbi:flavin-containing monooxygenase [Micromonospora cathayae]|uniref:NAD(P)-binding domain-containing protein n=1 Tax=Micromonospora cathayae TaxID=3028804 RepID=A0ABY7ZPD4_9ACTN|nr:NAD(P)-binding domain-containing protein [Micromonospora sp. HUAS 3]WDZ83804.1 NAD(P)-binding domain-containing protein [Micromonospora sp. HUAS 3]
MSHHQPAGERGPGTPEDAVPAAGPPPQWRDELRASLADADIPVLLMVLVHLTGDRKWIEEPFRPKRDVRLFPHESGGLSEEVQETVREAARTAIEQAYGRTDIAPVDPDRYAEMMSVCVGEPVPDAYTPLLLEEMGVRPWEPTWATPPEPARLDATHVVVVGAGLSGLCAAIRLKRAGIPFTVLEQNPEVGGTWYDNTYPESGVDTPNHFYSYSFFPSLDWTSYFSKQPEMLDYIRRTVDRFGIRDHIRFSTTVTRATWDADRRRWTLDVRTGDGPATLDAGAVIFAVGQLSQPSIPDFPGLVDFTGEVFHTARWRHDVELRDRRVAMIGAGASAMQVARSVADQAAQLTIFQRSPEWVAPNPDYHRRVSGEKLWLLRNVPHYAQWYRFVRFWRYGDGLHKSLFRDPEWPHPERAMNANNDRHRGYLTKYLLEQLDGRPDLVEKCLPDYPPYGKRMLVDNDWFTTIRRPHVDLVTDGVARIDADAVVTTAGDRYPADVIIMATGFHARRFVAPIEVVAHRSLAEVWADDNATAYLGITVPGFPNLFLMHGPNTALAHGGSVIFHAECQSRYIVSLLMTLVERGVDAVDVRQDVHDAYVKQIDDLHSRLVWSHPGMTNWYRNAAGRVIGVSPWRLLDYWQLTRSPDLADYHLA